MNNTDDLISRSDALRALGGDIMGGLNYKSILQKLPSRSTGQIDVMQQELSGLNSLIAVAEKMLNKLIDSQKFDQETIIWYDALTRTLDDFYIKKLNIENQMKEMGENQS